MDINYAIKFSIKTGCDCKDTARVLFGRFHSPRHTVLCAGGRVFFIVQKLQFNACDCNVAAKHYIRIICLKVDINFHSKSSFVTNTQYYLDLIVMVKLSLNIQNTVARIKYFKNIRYLNC